MEQLILKAAVTAATDQGVFTAVISTATVDRQNDIVEPTAVLASMQKWAQTGKKLPLAWGHSTAAADQIGHVDPATTMVQGNEVIATGWIDQTTEVGAHAWRLVKSGTLGFSYGFLVPDGGMAKRKEGGLHITNLDVYEVTATTIPANADTRVLTYKSAEPDRNIQESEPEVTDRQPETEVESVDPLRKASDELAMDVARGQVRRDGTARQVPASRQVEDDVRRGVRDMILSQIRHSQENQT